MDQATDSGLVTWHIGYKPSGSVCIMSKAELENLRTENAIDFNWPAKYGGGTLHRKAARVLRRPKTSTFGLWVLRMRKAENPCMLLH